MKSRSSRAKAAALFALSQKHRAAHTVLQSPLETPNLRACRAKCGTAALGSRWSWGYRFSIGQSIWLHAQFLEARIIHADRPDRAQDCAPSARPAVPDQFQPKGRISTTSWCEVNGDGVTGWGECARPSDPYYCPETTETCWHILRDFLTPAVLGREWATIEELTGLYERVKGNRFARAGLEMACWDLVARSRGQPLHSLLGGGRAEILSGVSLGIETRIEELLDLIARYLEEGYRRIKLKIAPGSDVEVVRRVRERYPDIALQVDANSAYTLDDLPTLKAARSVRAAARSSSRWPTTTSSTTPGFRSL